MNILVHERNNDKFEVECWFLILQGLAIFCFILLDHVKHCIMGWHVPNSLQFSFVNS
jgi:hypothetical protein